MLPRLYPTESEKRIRQINTLKVFNDNVTEIQEGAEYSVTFNAGGNELSLVVLLTSDFPNTKPILKITPIVIHPWVTADGDIKLAPGLLNFTVHSDLGRVVQAIIREFERTPPPLITDQSCSAITSPTVPREVDAMGRGSPSYTYNYNNIASFSPPTHSINCAQSIAFPDLNTLSLEELEFLNECTERQEEFIENLPQVKEMNKAMDDIICNIEELADYNLSKEDYLKTLNNNVTEKLEEVTKLAFDNDRLNSVYQSISEKYSPKNIKVQLSEAAEKSNSECERVADTFLNGDMDVDKFINTYIQIRTLNQTRKTKEEKLSQQLKNLEQAGF